MPLPGHSAASRQSSAPSHVRAFGRACTEMPELRPRRVARPPPSRHAARNPTAARANRQGPDMPTAVQRFSSTAAASSPDGASNDQALRRQPRPPCYTPADLDHQGQALVRPLRRGLGTTALCTTRWPRPRATAPLQAAALRRARNFGHEPHGPSAPTTDSSTWFPRRPRRAEPDPPRRPRPATRATRARRPDQAKPLILQIRRRVASAGPRNVHVTPCPGAAVPQSGQVTLPPRSSLVAPVASQEQPRPDPHSPATSAARALGGGVLTWEPPATYKRRHTERLTT